MASSFTVRRMFKQGNKELFAVTNRSGTSTNTVTTQRVKGNFKIVECSCSNVRAQPADKRCAHVRAFF